MSPHEEHDAERWERTERLFHAATDRPKAEREAFVRAACGADTAMAEQVLAMLAIDAESNALLDGGLASAAGAVLGESDASLPRQRFGPYRVTGVLGEGGMGVVYRGRREDLESEAAIKVLRDAAVSPARRERFAFEQRVLAQLNHPSIARLYDADALPDGTPWIAMELVEGEPITAYCSARELPLRARLELFREACEAVRYAHGHAILHRDVKPSNILVRNDGRVKLLDFGISKSLDALEDPADATRTGLRLMTPTYAAPEQVLGRPLGVHTDVYSLGVVLYELLAGRVPFDLAGRTPSEAASILTEQPVRRPSQAAREAGGPSAGSAAWNDLDVLCATAMHRDPARRYRTVDALIGDVDRFLSDEPLVARGDSFRYRAGKFVRRNAAAVTASAAGMAVLVAIVAIYTVRLAASRDAARAEAQRAQSIEKFLLSTLQGGDESAGPADTLRVITLLQRAVEQTRTLSPQSVERATLERELGTLLQSRGRLDQADTLLAAAYARTLRQPQPSDAELVRDELAIALLRSEQGRHEEAVRVARAALDRATRRVGPDDPLTLETLGGLGHVLSNGGRYDEAVKVLDEFVRRRRVAAPDAHELWAALTDLADTYQYLGRYREADSLERVLLEGSRRRLGPRHPDVATHLLNLGAIENSLGRYAQGERNFREALDIAHGWYGEDHELTASCLTYLGRALYYQDRFAEADTVLRRALVVKEHIYGPTHAAVAGVVSSMGDLALDHDRYDEALALFGRSADIYRAALGPHSGPLGIMYGNLGSVELNRGDNPAAERYFRQALEAYSGAVPSGHLDVAIARVKLGRALLRQKRYAEAERSTRSGYEVLVALTDPSISFLRAARKDLIEDYTALGRPDTAARFRAELADTSAKQ